LPEVAERDQVRLCAGRLFVRVAAGEFMMGGWGNNRSPDEGMNPRHRVAVKGFWVSVHPVTNVDYGRYLEASGVAAPEFWSDPKFNVWDQPVVGVSWSEAQEYLRWAEEGGRVCFRLPCEAEWEYACRAGTDGVYSFLGGSQELANYGWHDDDWEIGSAHGVGLLRPNGWGLFDSHGNVWEWCQDVWDYTAYYKRRRYSGSESWVAHAWTEYDADATGFKNIVLRGGSWNASAGECSARQRNRYREDYRTRILGFRAVCPEAGLGPVTECAGKHRGTEALDRGGRYRVVP
jgi:formylglycine-generating enzyme required for sulfatase activity